MTTSTYTISMLGPSRVGKTSIIASVFNTAEQELLAGKPFTLNSDNHKPTQKKLATHARELRSSIQAGDFNSGAVAGTQEPFTFKFELSSVKDSDVKLGFEILDFPGGWIDTINRPDSADSQWATCRETIMKSSVIIIPVEAGVIMNAKTQEQLRAVEYNLQTEDIKEIIKDWAKTRQNRYPNIPSTIIFAPVKGETYFKDNVNKHNKDRSTELYNLTQQYYKEIIETAQREFGDNRNLSIIYTAIDTIGSVTITYGDWHKEDDTLRFSGQYHITHNELKPKGGEDIFITICKTLVQTQKYQEELLFVQKSLDHDHAETLAKHAREQAEIDKGFFGNIGMWWSGERDKLRAEASKKEERSVQAKEVKEMQAKKLNAVATLIQEISKDELSSRTKAIV
ncbi:hypothetical protein [Moraxella lacunata]|uniref:hypothetical protein n=1 Tax=Moraxella lacunata TaxID=477 RepID=UPI003EE1E103